MCAVCGKDGKFPIAVHSLYEGSIAAQAPLVPRDNGENPSAAQTYLWFSQVATPWSLTSISNCQGAEGVALGTTPQATAGGQAIAQDMIGKCVKPQ